MDRRRIARAARRDEGTIAVFTAIVTVALLAIVGLVVDGGGKLRATERADALAIEAARAAGQAVDPSEAITGTAIRVDPQAAQAGQQSEAESSRTPTRAGSPVEPTAAQSSSDTVRQVALAAGIGALLAASLASALGAKRILQQRRRRAGETIAIDEDPTRLEQVLNSSGEPTGVARLDTVLRTLAHYAQEAGREVPAVRGARVTDQAVQLLADDPATDVLPPFTAGETPGMWVLDPSSPLLTPDTAREVPAPYPGLVTLGATDDGALLLANLMHTRALLLDGSHDDVLAVARAVALEAGTCAWSDHTEIMTVGLGARLATLLPRGRVRTMPHVQAVIADLGALLVEVHQSADHGPQAPEPLPWFLICASDVDAEHAWQLADAVAAARSLKVSVVLPASDVTRQAFPDAEQITTSPDAQTSLSQLGEDEVWLQRLTDDQYRQYVHALEVADEPAQPATGVWQLAEDHALAAAAPRRGAHPLLLHAVDGEGAEAGNPFPALLASAASPVRLVKSEDNDDEAAAVDTGPDEVTGGAGTDRPQARNTGTQAADDTDEEDAPVVPEINVLGPVQVSGTTGSSHGPKLAALAALVYLRPGRSAQSLCTAMDPVSPWTTRTLQNRLSELRSRFGTAPDGQPYLPRPHNGYAFAPGVRCDWDRFKQLAARGLAAGPGAGIADLEDALALVRGTPFEGQDLPWADSVEQEMRSRIVDVAHTLGTWLAEGEHPDLDAARQAVLRGLDIDETAEVLYRDWMHIEWTAGNTAGIHKAVARVQEVTRSYDIALEPLTEQTIDQVLADRPSLAHTSQA